MTEETINLLIMSKTPNYNKWIFESIKDYIGDNVLEIGCGIGNLTQFLKNQMKLMDKLVPLVSTFEKIVRIPVGLSVFLICKK